MILGPSVSSSSRPLRAAASRPRPAIHLVLFVRYERFVTVRTLVTHDPDFCVKPTRGQSHTLAPVPLTALDARVYVARVPASSRDVFRTELVRERSVRGTEVFCPSFLRRPVSKGVPLMVCQSWSFSSTRVLGRLLSGRNGPSYTSRCRVL